MKAELARIIDSRWPVIEWALSDRAKRGFPPPAIMPLRWRHRLAIWVLAMRDQPPPRPHTWLYKLLWFLYKHTETGRIHRATLGLIFDLYPDHVIITFPERHT